MFETNKILDDSVKYDEYFDEKLVGEAKQLIKKTQEKWKHYFWTNDKSLIPKAVKYMEKHGFIVRELKEIKSMREGQLKQYIDDYLVEDRAGAASDVARMAIMYEEGGFYIDMDFYLFKWDANVNRVFDFFGISQSQFQSYTDVLFNWGFLARPKHDIIKNFLDFYMENQRLARMTSDPRKKSEKQMWMQPCQKETFASILFDTGPYQFDWAYFKFIREQEKTIQDKNERDQICVVKDISHLLSWKTTLATLAGKKIDIEISGFQLGQGSWSNDYIDESRFGWPELNPYLKDEI
eukprot:403342133